MSSRRLFGLRVVLAAVAIWLFVYSFRYSRESLAAHQTYLPVPFTMAPFSNVVDSVVIPESGGLRTGDSVIAINARPFTGIAVYEQELQAADAAHVTEPAFTLLVEGEDGVRRNAVPVSGHCTCGLPSVWQILRYWVLPPLFCLVLGLVVVWWRPCSLTAWLFMALMICATQLTLLPDLPAGFRQTVDVRAWTEPTLRMAAVVHQTFWRTSWPAWLLLFAVLWLPRKSKTMPDLKPAVLLALCFVANAFLWCVFEVGWSEEY
jgi:hypothetical protein